MDLLSTAITVQLEGINDPKTAFTKFHELIEELYNKYFPIKTKVLSKKSQFKPWINCCLCRLYFLTFSYSLSVLRMTISES